VHFVLELMTEEARTQPELVTSTNVKSMTFAEALDNPDFVTEFEVACAAAFTHDYPDQEPGTIETLQETIAESNGLIHFIRGEGNEIIGGGVLKHYTAGDYGEGSAPSTELRAMFISPQERGKGLGFALTKARIEAAVAHGGNIFSTLNRGANQLELYRRLFAEVADSRGARIEDWMGDPTTDSYAYAYIEDPDDENVIIFQGSTPNGPKISAYAEVSANPDSFSPMRRNIQQIVGNDPPTRIDFDDGVSKSIGLTAEQFIQLRSKIENSGVTLEEKLALDGGPIQLLSITIVHAQ